MAKAKRFIKIILTLLCILVFLSIAWTAFSMIGRVKADAVIPGSADIRLSVSNPIRLLDGILSHESLDEIAALSPAFSVLNTLKENPILKNRIVRFAARGNLEFAVLPAQDGPQGAFLAVWDTGLFSPLLRIFPALSRFANIQNLYYVHAGKNSRFEYRVNGRALYIGPHRNLLFISSSSAIFE
jgi:hypothetical protein